MAATPVSSVAKATVALNQPRLTHFLCLPLVTSSSRQQLKDSLDNFKKDVTADHTEPEQTLHQEQTEAEKNGLVAGISGERVGGDCPGGLDGRFLEVPPRTGGPSGSSLEAAIPPKAIRPLGSLHLTLGVMSLLNPVDVQRAVDILNGLNFQTLFKDSPLNISLESLTSMHPQHKTSILYANPIDSSNRLVSFCKSLLEAFKSGSKENGDPLIVSDNRPLLLHATIVNTIYAKGGRGAAGKGHGKFRGKITIDATDTLENYKQFVWMKDVRLEKVAICRMGAKKLVDGEGKLTGDEEYEIEAEVNLP